MLATRRRRGQDQQLLVGAEKRIHGPRSTDPGVLDSRRELDLKLVDSTGNPYMFFLNIISAAGL